MTTIHFSGQVSRRSGYDFRNPFAEDDITVCCLQNRETSHRLISMNVKYLVFRFVRRHIPNRIYFILMKIFPGLLGDNAAETMPDAAFESYQHSLARFGVSFEGKNMVELGSGRYARQGLRMLKGGANRVTLIDPYAVSLGDLRHRKMLEEDCLRLGLSLDEALASISSVPASVSSFAEPEFAGHADVVISSAFLEHVRDPLRVLQRCYWILKPGGVTWHNVDLRDHYFAFPFEMLAYSDAVWEKLLAPKGGFYQNRWRLSDYLTAMEEAGFANIEYQVTLRDHEGLKKIRPRLQERFRQMDDDMLAILNVHLYGLKPE